MLEIQERFDTVGYEHLNSAAEELHITEALDSGRPIGFIAYSYEGDRTVVYDYAAGADCALIVNAHIPLGDAESAAEGVGGT